MEIEWKEHFLDKWKEYDNLAYIYIDIYVKLHDGVNKLSCIRN